MNDFAIDVRAVCGLVERERPRLIFVCNPNNPTGTYLDRARLETLLAMTTGLLVVDEAYVPFVDGPWDVRPLLDDPRLVVVRSSTKDHAIAGLRLGYALGDSAVVRAVQWAQPPWSVNAAAQAAGLAALEAEAHVERGRALAGEAKAYLADGLRALGLAPLPSAANFFLVAVPDAPGVADLLRAEVVCVRDCTSFGLPDYRALAARPLDECAALLAAIARVLRAAVARRGARMSESRGETGGAAPMLMVQGTASGVGKSALVAALCRLLRARPAGGAVQGAEHGAQRRRVTADGGEIGRAQALQAEAAGIDADRRHEPDPAQAGGRRAARRSSCCGRSIGSMTRARVPRAQAGAAGRSSPSALRPAARDATTWWSSRAPAARPRSTCAPATS